LIAVVTDVHRTGQLPELIRNTQWLPDSPEPLATVSGAQCWRSVRRSI